MTYPTIMPALTLDFQNSQQLDPRVTFSRSSSATYINSAGQVASAAEHEARFDHDPETGESLGLLIEEARTNLVQYSEDFSQTSQWAPVAASFNLDSASVAPDGSTGTYKVVEAATAGSHYARCLPSNQCIAGTTYTYSMFCKAAERTQIMIHFDQEGNNTYFDLSSGEIVSGTIGTIKSVGNGWYHCSITLNPANNTEPKFYIAVNGSISFSGDGVSGLYVWGAQLEAATFPTSYIPTAGSTATRAVDIAQMTGTNVTSWYSDAEGTFFYERVKQNTVFASQELWIGSLPWSQQNNISPTWYPNPLTQLEIKTANVQQPSSNTPSVPDKVAFALKNNDTVLAAGGALGNVVSSITLPGPIEYISVRYGTRIKRLTYYNQRLTDAELQTLTS